ncbi:MAG: Hsp33 family molecular chaperone HslO [Halioglobus sp.]|nr:Hsp33 family molecular chaperone HslO [Halioglobus sp.]
MPADDIVIPFLFESLPVRGALVQLKSAWQRMQLGRAYAGPVAEVLGHAAAASALIAQNLKPEGSITLQLRGNGPLSLLVIQCTSELKLRGMAHARAGNTALSFAELVAQSQCAITVSGRNMERPYQGIVDVSGETLAAGLECYFERSAQIPSHLALLSGPDVAGGLLLQKMPNGGDLDADDWQRLGLLASTLRGTDLSEVIAADLLGRLFADDDLRVFPARAAAFHCRCTRERAEDVLRMLGEREAMDAASEDGHVDIACEYCGRNRRFDTIDLKRLFAPSVPTSDSLH